MAVPGPPSSIAFSNITSTSVFANISDGANGGKTITARQIAYSKTFGSVSDFIANLSGTGMTIGSLSSSTTWSFRARAFNADGWGPWSSTFTARTLDPVATGSAPGAPTTGIGEVTQTSVYVSVQDGPSNGSPIDARQIGYSETFGGLTFVANVPGTAMAIQNLKSGTTYSFRSRTHNAFGWGAWGTSVTAKTLSVASPTVSVPGAPLAVTTSNPTNTSLTVDFTDPPDGGAPILERQIAYSKTFGSVTDFIVTMTSKPMVIGSLDPATEWSFRARCRNSAGWGPWGSVGTGYTLGGAVTIPGSPTLFLGTTTSSSVHVTIQDGDTGGGEITGRQIGYSTTFGALTFIVDVQGTSRTIDNLDPDTTWSFRARTQNSMGWGPWSTTYTKKTLVGTVPPAPLSIVAANPTPKTIDVSWRDNGDGGSPITQRQVAYSTTFGSVSGFVTLVTTNPVTIGDLTSNTTWSFRVRNGNRYGWGAWSATASNKTLATVPDAPSIVTITNITRNSVDTQFTAPKNNGGHPILEMQLGVGVKSDAPTNFVASTGTFQVTGLESGLTYYFWARARNIIGWGPWSPRSFAILKTGVFVMIDGAPKEVTPYVNVGGTWRRAQPHIRMSGFWRAM